MQAAEHDAQFRKMDPAWPASTAESFERLLQSGYRSSSVYYAYARMTTGNERLHALEEAVELERANGMAVFQLGLAYFERERWKEAAQQLRNTRRTLPELQREAVEFYLRIAAQNAGETP